MAENEEPKKDSLDDILSDLNDILQKMPEIPEEPKQPEGCPLASTPPAEAPAPAPVEDKAPETAGPPETMDASGNFERVLDLDEMKAGAAQGAEAKPASPAAEDGDKTLVIQSLGEALFSGSDETPAAPPPAGQPAAAAEVAPQAAPEPAPAAEAAPQQVPEPAAGTGGVPGLEGAIIGDAAAPAEEAPEPAAAPAADSGFAMTRDFGVPDIDMLLQMSSGGAAPQPSAGAPSTPEPASAEKPAEVATPCVEQAPAGGVFVQEQAQQPQAEIPADAFVIDQAAAEPVPTPEAEIPAPEAAAVETALAGELGGLDAAIIGQEPAAQSAPAEAEGGTVEPNKDDLDQEQPAPAPEQEPATEQAPAPAAETPQAEAQPQAEPAGVLSFGEDALAASPAPEPAPAAEPAAEQAPAPAAETPQAEPAGVLNFGEDALAAAPAPEPVAEQAPAPAAQPDEEKTLLMLPGELQQPEEEKTMLIVPGGGPSAEPGPQLVLGSAEPPAAASPEPQLSLGSAEPQLVLGSGDVPPELTVNPPQPEEEKTMLIVPGGGPAAGDPGLVLEPAAPPFSLDAPAPDSSPAEEKTVVMSADTFASTQRSRADLEQLAAKQTPDSVPENRQRGLGLLYSEEDKDLCAQALAELDAICTKSASKPMFIRRAFVKPCEVGMNGNFVLQMATDAKANGLLCIGSIPQETVYEMENVFNSSGLVFKHVQRDSYSRTAMLDVVMELILK